jgi:hypothetical protein
MKVVELRFFSFSLGSDAQTLSHTRNLFPSLLTSRRKAFLKMDSVTLQLRFLDVSLALLQNPPPKIAAFLAGLVGEEGKRENAPLGTNIFQP